MARTREGKRARRGAARSDGKPGDRSRMLELLGTACVGWTLFELSGLLHSARDRSVGDRNGDGNRARTRSDAASVPRSSARRDAPRRAAPHRPERARRFSAWDEQGNRIVVEDLGLR